MSAKKAIKERLQKLQHRVEEGTRRRIDKALKQSDVSNVDLQKVRESEIDRSEEDSELPVVARMMVEIRSDGRRTVARGALQDEASGQKVTLEAQGETPAQLAAQLTKSLLTLPLTSMQLTRTLLRRTNKK